MNIRELLAETGRHSACHALGQIAASKGKTALRLQGVKGVSASVLAAAAYIREPYSALFIAPDNEAALYVKTDLENLIGQQDVIYLPDSFIKPYAILQPDNHAVQERAEAIARLRSSTRPKFLVTWLGALAEQVIEEEEFDKSVFKLKTGDHIDLEFFMEFMYENRFERDDFVFEPGYFSVRGGIIDVFSFSGEHPYRIELDGDVIESIRTFDPVSQASIKDIGFFTFVPNIGDRSLKQDQTLFHYLPKDTVVHTENLPDQLEKLTAAWEKLAELADASPEHLQAALPEGVSSIRHPKEIFLPPGELIRQMSEFPNVEYGTRTRFEGSRLEELRQTAQPTFKKNFNLLIEHFAEKTAEGYKICVFSENARQIERLHTIFTDLGAQVQFEPIYTGLSHGFCDHDLKICFYTEHELFDRYYRYHRQDRYSRTAAITLKELRNLKPGDFVVHVDHGVGKFSGLEKMEMNGVRQEAVRIVYRDGDLLYVNINSLHKISKYSGKDGTVPVLHKLGSGVWEKQKATAKRKVKDIARELIALYAKRKAQKGFQYHPDSYLQVELEASFLYEDTPDQAKATEEVKKDMESEKPMDRLVCGDVGFGKTEVAIRAAFKAVTDGKQVAVLVPTTILAQQHYRTFSERLRDFPVQVDYLNRFKSAKDQKETIKAVADGKVDILIGTHRLISKDIKFKDLGLLIVDEEQKFGVSIKEKLKEIRVNVDTLTLTATPIPRTLHFSLMGARDLSIINTAPPNRQPVHTELHAFNREVIAQAINFEVARGGQVFFVHHRIRDIYEIKHMLETICPGVRVAVGHGQMEGHELEDVMVKFVEGDFDVLVATTIIEAGLDIPNANTIIINNAHMFGLSDIHQMRGRVGRSNKRAFCYLLAPPLNSLTEDARKRLRTIEELNDLGSGFQVSMRDLDIRGAGNLLGAEQSGFISELGFETYHKILDEAMRELKQEEFSELFEDVKEDISSRECQVETDYEMLIPNSFVSNTGERLSLYNELAQVDNEQKLYAFSVMLKDRFGKLPPEVERLLETMRLKWTGKNLGFEKLVLGSNALKLYLPGDEHAAIFQSEKFDRLMAYIASQPNKFAAKQTGKALYFIAKNVGSVYEAMYLLKEMEQAMDSGVRAAGG